MQFMRYRPLYYALSLLVIIPGVISLYFWGLNLSVDFTGGTLVEYQFSQTLPPQSDLSAYLNQLNPAPAAIITTTNSSYILKFPPLTRQQTQTLISDLTDHYQTEVVELRLETVGPILGRELITKTLYAVLIAAGLIMLYMAYQFKNRAFGVTAIAAMFHDTLILLGVFSLLGHFYGFEVDVLFVTAVLTVLSFSVHDTIVVYDRIRESLKKHPNTEFESIVNKAVTETLGRSLNNSLTIIIMLLALFLFGGDTIKTFVLALLVGTIAGTYSSTFTAAPLLVSWMKFRAHQDADKAK